MAGRGSFGQAGTAAVEFALVLPMLLVLVLGTVEVGLVILSHASMNTTMARVPDLARGAKDTDELDTWLADLAALRLGLGLAQVSFAPVTESWICPADTVDLAEDMQPAPPACDDETAPVRLYTVTGSVRVPSLNPASEVPGGLTRHARLRVPAP